MSSSEELSRGASSPLPSPSPVPPSLQEDEKKEKDVTGGKATEVFEVVRSPTPVRQRQESRTRIYVPINVSGVEVSIDLINLAKRLLLPEAEVIAASKIRGKLEQIIQEHDVAFRLIVEAELKERRNRVEAHIAPKAGLGYSPDLLVKVGKEFKKNNAIFQVEGKIYLAVHGLLDRKIHFIPLHSEKHLGSGGFASVSRIETLAGRVHMMKVAKMDYFDLTKAGKEMRVVQFLNRAGGHPGVQGPMVCQLSLNLEEAETKKLWLYHFEREGKDIEEGKTIRDIQIGHYIEGDELMEVLIQINKKKREKLTPQECLKITQKLMEALKFFSVDQNVSHADLKPDNIMLRNKDMEPVIIDWGSGTILRTDEPADLSDFEETTTRTSHYYDRQVANEEDSTIVKGREALQQVMTAMLDLKELEAGGEQGTMPAAFAKAKIRDLQNEANMCKRELWRLKQYQDFYGMARVIAVLWTLYPASHHATREFQKVLDTTPCAALLTEMYAITAKNFDDETIKIFTKKWEAFQLPK